MAIDLSENCIGYWKMNDSAENKTVIDSSEQAHDGQAQRNTSILSQTGKLNTALKFERSLSDYISFGTGPAIVGTGAFAVSLWVKIIELNQNQMLVNQRATSFATGSYAVSVKSDNKIHFEVYNAGLGFSFDSDTAITDNNWHLVIAQRINSTTGELYLDTNNVGSGQGAAKSLNAVLVCAGRWNGGSGWHLDGIIDDLRIWDGKVLSADERAFLWNNGLGTENMKSCARPLVGGSLAGKRGLT